MVPIRAMKEGLGSRLWAERVPGLSEQAKQSGLENVVLVEGDLEPELDKVVALI